MKVDYKKKTRKPGKGSKKYIELRNRRTAILIAFFSALLIAAICIGISVQHAHRSSFHFDTDADKVQGVDVSEHNGEVDWKQLRTDAEFAIIRVGYRGYNNGSLQADKTAKKNLRAAKRADVPVGVYFYSQAVTPQEAEEEAQFVLDFVRHYDVVLPVFIDYEYAYGSDGTHAGRLFDAALTPQEATEVLNAFCKQVTDAGYTAGVYASTYFYNDKFIPSKLKRGTVKWVADYNKEITYTGDYDIWQYSKTGVLSGNGSKYIDLNYWYVNP